MKRASGLFPAIAELDNLRLAYCKARRGKQDRPDVLAFACGLEANLRRLRADLLAGTVQVGPYRHFTVYEPKERIISVAPFRDRVLHHAIINLCEPVFEAYQIHRSYACRRGRGTYAALDQARAFAAGNPWYLKLDVRKYFDSIPHDRLKALLRRRFKDPALLALFDRMIDSHGGDTGHGLPIGNLTSQYLANHYLAVADHYVRETLRRKAYVRYMDDMVLWGDSSERLVTLGSRLTASIERELGLELKPWCLNRSEQGLPFLGHVIYREMVTLNARSRRRYEARLLENCRRLASGQWTQETFAAHVHALVAVTEYAGETEFRRQINSRIEGIVPWVRTA